MWIKGQLERGEETGYLHYQVLVCLHSKQRLSRVKSIFGERIHAEPSRSSAAEVYVWKEETRVPDTQFEFGNKPFKRNDSQDWQRVWDLAVAGRIMDIHPEVRFPHYRTIKQIEKDYMKPVAQEKTVKLYWGRSGAGKSRRAWAEAGWDAYVKDPNTKYWDGYQGQENVVIDEFRGKIDVSHLLRWLDRYPVNVECKFGACTFRAKNIWITSNLSVRQWFPEIDDRTLDAITRRMEIIEFL